LKKLGKGAYGKVYLVRKKTTNDIYAMKIVKIGKNVIF
jgi:serine/threonine protein kinase